MFKQERKSIYALFTFLHLFRNFCGAFNLAEKQRSQQLHSTLLLKRLPSSIYSTPSDGKHSYVEGATFDDKFAEIEAMGGDPFFLDDEDNDDEENEVKMDEKKSLVVPDFGSFLTEVDKSTVTNGKGPTRQQEKKKSDDTDTKWEWDGIVDEDAHMDIG